MNASEYCIFDILESISIFIEFLSFILEEVLINLQILFHFVHFSKLVFIVLQVCISFSQSFLINELVNLIEMLLKFVFLLFAVLLKLLLNVILFQTLPLLLFHLLMKLEDVLNQCVKKEVYMLSWLDHALFNLHLINSVLRLIHFRLILILEIYAPILEILKIMILMPLFKTLLAHKFLILPTKPSELDVIMNWTWKLCTV